MAKLLIVGGGISGLAAGVLAAKNGFQVEVYEKNAQPGCLAPLPAARCALCGRP